MEARRKFTREFKEAVARSAERGTPVKELARVSNLSPEVVRQWRDELRELGPHAFAGNRRRKFSKEFKEAAVLRVEQGTPLKEVARSCRITPHSLRRWRDQLQASGGAAFVNGKRKNKAVIFRLTEDEHKRLKALSKAEGARSVSDFARSRLLSETLLR